MATDLERQAAVRLRVDDYEAGRCGNSVRNLRVGKFNAGDLHQALVGHGFRFRRLAIPAYRTRREAPQWRTKTGVTANFTDADVAHEDLYVHGDGGVVRVYATVGPTAAFEEVSRGAPFARKSVQLAPLPVPSLAEEACAVSEDGEALPRTLRSEDGLKYDDAERLLSYRLAGTSFGKQVIPLKKGPPVRSPAIQGCGIALGTTLVAAGDFAEFSTEVRAAAKRMGAVVERVRGGDMQLFFTGSQAVLKQPRIDDLWHSLASLDLHGGAFVASIQPFGYDASVEQLRVFLIALCERFPDLRFIENASGEDVTKTAVRFPHLLFDARGPHAATPK